MTKIKTKPAHWIECSKCLASVGFGKKVVSRLFNTSVASIKQKWKSEGIYCNIPPCGSWKAHVQNKQRPQKLLFKKYEKLWMKEIKRQKKHGFSWGAFWEYDVKLIKEGKEMSKTWIGQRKKMSDEERKEKRRAYNSTEKSRAARRKYRKERKRRDPAWRALRNNRKRLRQLVKKAKDGGCIRKSSLLGCSTKQFKIYMESKFTKKMTWENYGTYWHLDHILPCAIFDHGDEDQVKQCHHWTNLQPLEASLNLAKSDKVESDIQIKMLI